MPGIVAHACNSSNQETEVEGQDRQPVSNNKQTETSLPYIKVLTHCTRQLKRKCKPNAPMKCKAFNVQQTQSYFYKWASEKKIVMEDRNEVTIMEEVNFTLPLVKGQ